MELNDKLIAHLRKEAKDVHHGRITIELNETANKIDIVTESRERFKNEPKPVKDLKKGEFKKG